SPFAFVTGVRTMRVASVCLSLVLSLSLWGCSGSLCGNGIIDPGEQCDDGNNIVGDGCQPDCTLPASCNNGIVERGDFCLLQNQTFPTGNAPDVVAAADFNGDGKLDLAVTTLLEDSVSTLLGNGDGTFQTHQDFAVGFTPTGMVIADFNGDGKPDIA